MAYKQGAEKEPGDSLTPPGWVDGQVRHVDLVSDRPEAQIADHGRRPVPLAGAPSPRHPESSDPVPFQLVQKGLTRPRRVEGHTLDLEHRLEVGGPHRLN